MQDKPTIESLIALETSLTSAIGAATEAMLYSFECEGCVADVVDVAESLRLALARLSAARRNVRSAKQELYDAEAD